MNNILDRLLGLYPELSKKHQLVANYIFENASDVAFMNLAELARESKVSNATITRFAISLGYEGFPDFQKDIQKSAFNHIPPRNQVDILTSSSDEIFESMLENFAKTQSTYSQRDLQTVIGAAELISKSKKVFITGYQWSKSLVEATSYELRKYTNGVFPVLDNSFANYDLITDKPQKSCAIVFAMPRYPGRTMEHFKHFQKLDIPIILFTDDFFPFKNQAKHLFTIPLFGAATSVVFPQILILAIIQEIISRVIINNPELAKKRSAKFEESAKGKYLSIESLLS